MKKYIGITFWIIFGTLYIAFMGLAGLEAAATRAKVTASIQETQIAVEEIDSHIDILTADVTASESMTALTSGVGRWENVTITSDVGRWENVTMPGENTDITLRDNSPFVWKAEDSSFVWKATPPPESMITFVPWEGEDGQYLRRDEGTGVLKWTELPLTETDCPETPSISTQLISLVRPAIPWMGILLGLRIISTLIWKIWSIRLLP